MNVMADQSFGSLPRRFLLGGRLSLFPEDIDGALDIAERFDKRRTAVGEPGARAFAEFLYHLCRNIDRIGWIRHSEMYSLIVNFCE